MPATNATPPGSAKPGPTPPRGAGWRTLLLSAAYFFLILTAYYMLRPIRETMAIEKGADKLPWLMTATLVAMLVANPLYALLVSRLPRRRFVPVAHGFLALNIVGFFGASRTLAPETLHLLGYAFYVWLSVFNLFVVSIFWSLMADIFREEQAKRVFGVVAVGGTLGAICGPVIVDALLGGALSVRLPLDDGGPAWTIADFPALSREWVFLAALIPLAGAVLCARSLIRRSERAASEGEAMEPTRDALAGFRLIAGSRYLKALSLYMLLFTVTSTLVYLEQARVIATHFASDTERAQAFARLDFYTNTLTLLAQLVLTRQIIRVIGVGGTLAVLPTLTFAGFGALAATGSVPVLFGYQVMRRGVHYAIDRPAREVLFTPLSPDEKYKSKAFIDTFVYRAGDMLGGWAPTWLAALGGWLQLASPIPNWTLWLPLSLLWIVVAFLLGAMLRRIGSAAVPNPETPNPETPNPETPNPETPNAETPNPETPNAETPNPEIRSRGARGSQRR